MNTWQLPESIDELVGDRALEFESVRRQLIDLYTKKGFSLVIPPMVENIESLLLTSDSINEKTFKFLDPTSGKMLGVHADITPQIARIDAKQGNNKVAKYCYINAILQTRADDFYASRSPIQAGAELYGSDDISADVEVIELMLESLKLLSIKPITLSLGNVAVFNALIAEEALDEGKLSELRQIFVKRSTPDLVVFLQDNTLIYGDKFSALMRLEGNASILDEALVIFKDIPKAKTAIQDLLKINEKLSATGVEVVLDLGEFKAYEYHTGVVFSAYNENYPKALAQGGRYNGLSASFGCSRAATGFSFDLKFLSQRN
ncbi:ATP phosphoribosyltransferase regulatory subunit [Bathymodiolus heckerae thiotrophic gill symbiont]|uniref:ATP phosphoribosyltransferase regulatory subunit n=1 Tax=Bathymodiolus heckerae thiotrophic gill symbiont TaxID=1052212 RepID=UPI0010B63DB5|nr:ATP phosphoribosyltransferase regulatory subunit [Bathymodiolus heckerae thiotrophic gill symbiont]SMN12858.1 ATP phosphoribosyltransferase regulatory subunit [Bathymodiolus heckerae thiotrophic gill symbiont]SMN14562.1 ATP phosphoribosyltransferase regulatory subunit [uncultured Candidatus Thioglobus sp.]